MNRPFKLNTKANLTSNPAWAKTRLGSPTHAPRAPLRPKSAQPAAPLLHTRARVVAAGDWRSPLELPFLWLGDVHPAVVWCLRMGGGGRRLLPPVDGVPHGWGEEIERGEEKEIVRPRCAARIPNNGSQLGYPPPEPTPALHQSDPDTRDSRCPPPPCHRPRRADPPNAGRGRRAHPPRSPASEIRAPPASPALRGSPCEVHGPPRR